MPLFSFSDYIYRYFDNVFICQTPGAVPALPEAVRLRGRGERIRGRVPGGGRDTEGAPGGVGGAHNVQNFSLNGLFQITGKALEFKKIVDK